MYSRLNLITKSLSNSIRFNSTSTSSIKINNEVSSSSDSFISSLTPTPTPSSSSNSNSSDSNSSSSSSSIKTPKLKSKQTPAPIHNIPTLPFAKHYPIPPTDSSIHVATLQLRSHTTSLSSLTFFTNFALRAAKALNLSTSGVISLPTKISLYTTPRSPFAHKKSQENFWKKEHKRSIKIYDGSEQTVGIWLAYLRKEAMGGVGMKAQLFTYRELGWGNEMVKEEVRSSALILEDEGGVSVGGGEVEKLAKEIMEEIKLEVESRESEQQSMSEKIEVQEAEEVVGKSL